MAAHVIAIEGPIFDDVLVHRIAQAHKFGRAAGRIRETVLAVVERKFPVSNEDGRKIFWPEGADKSELPAFRMGSLDDRDHVDIPLVELGALARRFLDSGAEPAEAARCDLVLESIHESLPAKLPTTTKTVNARAP